VKDWKACERKVAALLGGRRIPVSGRGRGDNPDIHHELFSIEVKSRKTIPAWLEDAMRQAEASVKDGRLPVVVLHQDRTPYAESLVVLRLEDFAGYLKGES
jgi:hypothetical protein